MLAIHWSPVSNTKSILKNGIRKSKTGLYCFPLTGHRQLDRWWLKFLNKGTRGRKTYNGFLFRLQQSDFPAYFGYWQSATTKDSFIKEIQSLKDLQIQYKDIMLFRLGECINLGGQPRSYESYISIAEEAITSNPSLLSEKMNCPAFMNYTLEEYQIVLSKSISPERILRILPQHDEFGRIIRRKKDGS